mmetsp:Transcript_14916/g.41915  ORF Transcript_14916/g.41915 Transcript_14916/m.41915 type:complete len:314 (-) Transcript_14916:260-1201(-)|eukprot:CAMPEP_0117664400 /NCGR_PEP_ID=MMETSP0804-20121206/9198_1 /TAXON_ID=1074897 /ORGANISM="Tetraselmis astigmatica, Strain CCMP880" /LENGTH=313 /DNA_ID=CAMNT_0005471627 /DNA_START=155 /DNA_END=1096 /DNA_ORIENTATION=+
MPHLMTNRPRFYHAKGKKFDWELPNILGYLVGGFLFIPGSVFFLPQYEDHVAIGAWLYTIGSLMYLMVSLHDLVEMTSHLKMALHDTSDHHLLTLKEIREQHWLRQRGWKLLEWYVAGLYTSGSAIFVVGSICFLPNLPYPANTVGTWLFLFGSLIFISGAICNMLQLYTVTSPLTVQLLNCIASDFLVGSLFFLVGSIVYLMPWGSDQAWYVADTLAGGLFTAGSCLFFGGGIVNWIRIMEARRFHILQGGKTKVLRQQKAHRLDKKDTSKKHMQFGKAAGDDNGQEEEKEEQKATGGDVKVEATGSPEAQV